MIWFCVWSQIDHDRDEYVFFFSMVSPVWLELSHKQSRLTGNIPHSIVVYVIEKLPNRSWTIAYAVPGPGPILQCSLGPGDSEMQSYQPGSWDILVPASPSQFINKLRSPFMKLLILLPVVSQWTNEFEGTLM